MESKDVCANTVLTDQKKMNQQPQNQPTQESPTNQPKPIQYSHQHKGTDLSGLKVGKWNILKPTESKRYHFDCQCDCGTLRTIVRWDLEFGKTMQCQRCNIKRIKTGEYLKYGRS